LELVEVQLSYRADAVGNGKEALEALGRVNYDRVLMDCQMPEMDGYEATRAIRDPVSSVLNDVVLIVAMSANAMKGDREEWMAAGMNEYVAEPIRIERLAEATERSLSDLDEADPASAGESAVDSMQHLDLDSLLGRVNYDRPAAGKLLEQFFDAAPRQIDEVRTAIGAGVLASVRWAAHDLKHAAGDVRAEALAGLALRIEIAARDGDIETVTHLAARMGPELDRLTQERQALRLGNQ